MNLRKDKMITEKCHQQIRSQHDQIACCTNQQPPQRSSAVTEPGRLGQNGCWPIIGFQIFRALPKPIVFYAVLPSVLFTVKGQHTLSMIGRLSFPICFPASIFLTFLFFLPVMSGNVHPNPGPIFPVLCAPAM